MTDQNIKSEFIQPILEFQEDVQESLQVIISQSIDLMQNLTDDDYLSDLKLNDQNINFSKKNYESDDDSQQ